MLEKMSDFFAARLNGYDEHMLKNIEGAPEFYPFTASLLPKGKDAKILDLGCGTGLELGFYFDINPTARVMGIDLCESMLNNLKAKFPDKSLELVCDSYFDFPFERENFHAAVSVESLHHFTKARKLPLYKKLHEALAPGGYFILTDYFAESDESEKFFARELARLKKEQGIADDEFYHYDTPLTVEHETEALTGAGFSKVERANQWANTVTLLAWR